MSKLGSSGAQQSAGASLGHVAALGTIIIWGTTFVATKILLRDFNPVEILFMRFLLGYLVLLLMHPRIIKPVSIKQELVFAAAGLTGVTLYYLFENIALTYTYASNVGVLVAISPLFTAILAHFLIKGERLRLNFVIGFAVAAVGIVLVGFNGNVVLRLNPLGDILAVLASLVWAVYSILMKTIMDYRYHAIDCTRRIFFYGTLFMLPALHYMDFSPSLTDILKPENLFNLIYLSVGATALCFWVWNWVVGVLGTVKTNTYIYAVPVVSIIASALVLKENITPLAYCGAALTLVGLYLSERRQGVGGLLARFTMKKIARKDETV